MNKDLQNQLKKDHSLLVEWYKQNKRPLPWRKNQDPYRVWLSEVMLQQTTVVAVMPYFEKFTQKFKNVNDLAKAPLEEVYELWAGLGYYSRARNLHKAAQLISAQGFPQTAAELLELPGFGPYTSRAVASIAFGEKVGVLDGNVIRVLCRKYGLELEWWGQKAKQQLQKLSDDMALLGEPEHINQALMELGATVCTPQKTACVLCPWLKTCVANKTNKVAELPLKKPRKKSEVWVWQIELGLQKNKVALKQNDYAPFLKGQWIFPGTIQKSSTKPKDYNARHSITHHDIFIQIKTQKSFNQKDVKWVELSELKKINPSSVLSKVLEKVK